MLTARERRLFGEIAEALDREDPSFVRQFRRAPESPGSGRPVALCLTASLLALIVCTILLLPVAAVTASACAVGVLVFAATRARRPTPSP